MTTGVAVVSGGRSGTTRVVFGAIGALLVVAGYLAEIAYPRGAEPSLVMDFLIAVVGAAMGAAVLAGAYRVWNAEQESFSKVKSIVVALGALGIWYSYLVEPKVRSLVLGVAIAIGVSAALFIGVNKWFDQARKNWRRFGIVTGVIVALVVGALLVGNNALGWRPSGESGANLSWYLPLILAAVAGVWGWILAGTEGRPARVIVGVVGGLVLAGIVAAFLRPAAYPRLQSLPLIIYPVGFAAVGYGLALLRRKKVLLGAVSGATVGWLIGTFGIPSLGGTNSAEAFLAVAGLGLGIGLRLGLAERADYHRREWLHGKSRAVIFLAPALGFIAMSLVIPTLRTLYISFRDGRGEEGVGFKNYSEIFTSSEIVDVSNWSGVFSSSLFWWAVVLAGVGIVVGRVGGRKVGRGFDATGGSVSPIALAIFFFAFALFTNLRGTFFNNLWWVFTVTLLATGLGLAIAVLADRGKFETVAKSLIFMPMAISFVGASIIWRLVYVARDVSKEQTGVLNAMWVGLGKLSNSAGGVILAIALIVVAAALGYLAYRGRKADEAGLMAGSIVAAIPFLWIAYRLLGPGIGGFARDEAGNALFAADGNLVSETILFIQEQPFNNLWLMAVLIWIQAGFAMVILSAAIKAVPAELIEASKVDGATESQTFWRVTIPQIASTIGVVVTTLIITVTKVFDIVKVMTNGSFQTQVLANEMWQRAFTEFNLGLGSALAVVLFLMVLPVMYLNIRRMQREAA